MSFFTTLTDPLIVRDPETHIFPAVRAVTDHDFLHARAPYRTVGIRWTFKAGSYWYGITFIAALPQCQVSAQYP